MLESANENVTMVILPRSEWNEVRDSLQDIKNLISQKGTNSDEWIPSDDARVMLGVSKKTWQTYRDNREISFSQRGRKIYVLKSDIEKFMQKHYIRSKDMADDGEPLAQDKKAGRKETANGCKKTSAVR